VKLLPGKQTSKKNKRGILREENTWRSGEENNTFSDSPYNSEIVWWWEADENACPGQNEQLLALMIG